MKKRASLKPEGGSWDILVLYFKMLSHGIKCFMKWGFHQQKTFKQKLDDYHLLFRGLRITLDLITSALLRCWYSSSPEVE